MTIFNSLENAYITTDGTDLVKAKVKNSTFSYRDDGTATLSVELDCLETINTNYLKDVDPAVFMALIEGGDIKENGDSTHVMLPF